MCMRTVQRMFTAPGSGAVGNAAVEQRAAEDDRQQRIRDGASRVNQAFDSQFTPEFFAGRRQGFVDFATPQLQSQFQDAQRELTFALARSGQLDSSERARRESELSRLFDQRSREISNQALDFETRARSGVEDARSTLISQLNATGNADQAARDASARAVALSQPDSYSPVTDLFGTFIQGLGAQAAQERTAALSGGAYRPNFDTGLFRPRSGAVTVSN